MSESHLTNPILTTEDIEVFEQQFKNFILSQSGVRTRRGLLAMLTQSTDEWITQAKTLSEQDQDAFLELAQAGHELIQFLQNYLQAHEDALAQLLYGMAHSGILSSSDLSMLNLTDDLS